MTFEINTDKFVVSEVFNQSIGDCGLYINSLNIYFWGREVSQVLFSHMNSSLANQTFLVGGVCGKGKIMSGNSCQHSEFSWNLKFSRKSRTLARAQHAHACLILHARVESL